MILRKNTQISEGATLPKIGLVKLEQPCSNSLTILLESIIHPQGEVAEGYGPVSSMPEMKPLLTPLEVRDLVAYLSTLR